MRILYTFLFLLYPLIALAQLTHYGDVQQGAWFEDEVADFLAQGYLDSSQPNFRPADPASRAEFMKVIVELNGGILDEIPASPSFMDVSAGDWFFGYLEESAREGWTRGDGDCYGSTSLTTGGSSDCRVRPRDPVTRAEAAVLIRRAFGKKRLSKAPAFADNSQGQWFSDAVQAAADHCILRGDEGTRNVRPHDLLNRAEMVVMLWRVDGAGEYPGC